MTLNRRLLAKIDGRLRSEMDHTEGVQLVKVTVSDAVWSTWRRYCDLAGVPMGGGLAILLHHELASVAEVDLETVGDRLQAREAEIDTRSSELTGREADLKRRERSARTKEASLAGKKQRLDRRKEQLDERAQDLDQREANAVTAEKRIAEQLSRMTRTPATRSRPKLGRNESCWCGSGKKYKNCHLINDQGGSE